MLKFELVNQMALVMKVDPIRGKNDNAFISVRVRLQLSDVPSHAVAGALGADDPAAIRAQFFKPFDVDPDEGRSLLNLDSLRLRQGFKNKHHATIKGQKRMRCSNVSNISFEPTRSGKFDGSMMITFEKPKPGFVEWISENLWRRIFINLEQDGDLFLDPPPEESPVTTTVGEPVAGSEIGDADSISATKEKIAKPARKRPAKKGGKPPRTKR